MILFSLVVGKKFVQYVVRRNDKLRAARSVGFPSWNSLY